MDVTWKKIWNLQHQNYAGKTKEKIVRYFECLTIYISFHFDVPISTDYEFRFIDVFFKVKALHKPVSRSLHIAEYGRTEQKELEKYCKKIYIAEEEFTVIAFQYTPYIVLTRSSDQLKRCWASFRQSIMEGLHSTFY